MGQNILGNLHYAAGSRKPRKRIGRGQGSGHGGTSTRGHKGAGARSGTRYRPWFEGGQMPLARRVPKFGFVNPFRIAYQGVNIVTLEKLAAGGKVNGGKITPEILYNLGVISKKKIPVKILGTGELKTSLDVTADAFSASAVQKIEAVGGKVHKINSDMNAVPSQSKKA